MRGLKDIFQFLYTSSTPLDERYVPDGEPRIPRKGDVILIAGELVKLTYPLQTKRQVYKRI